MNGWVVLFMVLEFLFLAAGVVLSSREQSVPAQYHAAQRLTAPRFALAPGQDVEWNFEVPTICGDVHVRGDFQAGPGPVEMFIADEAGFIAWKQQQQVKKYYESGLVAQGQVNLGLPSQPRMYYLVFSSPRSPSIAQEIRADIRLHYTCEVIRGGSLPRAASAPVITTAPTQSGAEWCLVRQILFQDWDHE